jgi:hypothetical protein
MDGRHPGDLPGHRSRLTGRLPLHQPCDLRPAVAAARGRTSGAHTLYASACWAPAGPAQYLVDAGVLAAAGSREDLAALEPVELAMLCASAYAAQGDRDTAIAAFEALADRYPDLGGFALSAAQLRLERVVDSTSPGHASDIRQARQLALRARDARRRWRGDSAEAVVVACHAAMIAVDSTTCSPRADGP